MENLNTARWLYVKLHHYYENQEKATSLSVDIASGKYNGENLQNRKSAILLAEGIAAEIKKEILIHYPDLKF